MPAAGHLGLSIGTYLNTFHLHVIRLGTADAGMAGTLYYVDCLPMAFTPGVVDLVAAATSYVQSVDGKK